MFVSAGSCVAVSCSPACARARDGESVCLRLDERNCTPEVLSTACTCTCVCACACVYDGDVPACMFAMYLR
eukprot:6188177-Pleurochrysis_carterae.AAC.1